MSPCKGSFSCLAWHIGVLRVYPHGHVFKYLWKTGVLLTSSRVWTSGFVDVILLFCTNLDLEDESFGGLIKGELGVALKGAEGAPMFQSWLHFAGPFCHNAVPQVSIQDV